MPVVPLRREPNDRSEIMTQILFGETVRIFETTQKWLSVETDMDHYPGWVDRQQITLVDQAEHSRVLNSAGHLTLAPLTTAHCGGLALLLPAGSRIPAPEKGMFGLAGETFTLHGETRAIVPGTPQGVSEYALNFLNAPYLWGGRTHLGIDCSGLTQAAFRMNGCDLPRDASQQAGAGMNVNLLSEAAEGDLAFFDDEQGKIVHVGLILAQGHIIHASGKVRIDVLDHQGIFRSGERRYTHRLRLIKRVMQ